MKTRAILIAGASSGSGKTTLTLGMMAALRKRGLAVQGFKAGPDYIDPSLHHRITGRPSINLDTWMMPADFLQRSFQSRAAAADISIIEGVMGLYDGKDPVSERGSTAELAVRLGVPVILVIDAAAMVRTAAALVNGLIAFDERVNIIGVVFNRIGSENHLQLLTQSISAYCRVPVLGGLPADGKIDIPSRHLGLYMGDDGVLDGEIAGGLAEIVAKHVDLEQVLGRCEMSVPDTELFLTPSKRDQGEIAVARDRAFCFYYQDNFNILDHLGYRLTFFSPLNDSILPATADAYYFGGGYPELYAEKLAANEPMRDAVQAASKAGRFIYGECGGLMYLGQSLIDVDNQTFPMCGCLPYKTQMHPRLQSLGYVEFEPATDFLFFAPGHRLRGHCFHYSTLIEDQRSTPNAYNGQPADKAVAIRALNTMASYVHAHFSGLFSG